MNGDETPRSPFRPDLIADRVAIVTGGATGLGADVSRVFGEHGASVVICSRKEENLAATTAALQADGIDCRYVVCDVRQPDQVEAVVSQTLAWHGRLDIVVNNAAGNFPVPIDDLSYNGFKTVVDIDLLGTYNVSKAAYEAWLRDHGGAIVNITAAIQYTGMAYQAHVASAKAGIDALTRTCAIEWGPRGIRTNVMAPGGMAGTEGMRRFEGRSRDPNSTNPLGRIGHVREMAHAVLYLASDAASYVNGELLVVDGGGWLSRGKLSLTDHPDG
ncbi:MAG: SDR family oxidoreductase [Acidimicrobiales bacterium]|nr:SDR family oxidoreductase [Acidimicrobiales bacterium]